MKKKKVLSHVEYWGFALFMLTALTNKLWLSNEYLETISWTFMLISLIAATNNRDGKSPWVLTIDLIFGIAVIIIVISDIISYLR